MPLGLLPSRWPQETRKKSLPAPTAPFAPAPERRRRLDVSCGTNLPAGKHHPPVLSSGDAQTKRPARTVPREPVWFSVSPNPTTAFGSRTRDASVPLGRSLPAASASQTKRRFALDQLQGRYRGGPEF